jgi:uncharacterized RDD family membrane protein YckC
MSQQPSGWYDDPSNPEMLRYWDGVVWTNHTVPKKSPTASQSTIGLPQQPQTPNAPQRTTPMPQGGGWQGQNAPQQQYPPQHQQPSQYPSQSPSQYPQVPGGAAWMVGPATADGVPLASWGRRLVARVLDNVITATLTAVVGWTWLNDLLTWYSDIVRRTIDSGVAPDPVQLSEQAVTYLLPLSIVGLVVGVLYETLFLMRTGATPGKMALGISVRRTGAAGPLDLLSALKRQVIQIGASATSSIQALSTVVGMLSLLDYLWPLWDSKRQALHDKIADTQVVMGKQSRQQR